MKSTQRLLILAMSAIAVLLFATYGAPGPSPAQAAVTVYTVEDLGPDLVGRSINANGDVAGYGGWPYRAFVWTEANGITWLPCDATNCFAYDINDLGEVVGQHGGAAARWSADGTLFDLGILPGGTEATAHATNNDGLVVGESYTGTGFEDIHAFVYTDADGMVDITPNAGLSRAYDVNSVGQVAGHTNSVAFRWENGVLTTLGVLPGDAYSFGKAINASGQVAGTSTTANGNAVHAFRYTDGVGMEDLGVVGEANEVWGINGFGDVVGHGKTFGSVQKGFIYTDANGLQDLNTLIDTPDKWSIAYAHAINDAGQIVALGYDRVLGGSHTLRLVPQSVEPTITPTATLEPTATAAPEATPTPAPDFVTITRAEYHTRKNELTVQATSSDTGTILNVYVTASHAFIGAMDSHGQDKYQGRFAWPQNPVNITVVNTNGGASDSADVVLK